MAAKRKTTRTTTTREDLAQPTKWRLQHGGFTAPVREADPDTGSTVVHRRAVDTLGMMLANGTITQEMHDAGGYFRTLFRRAALDGMPRSQLMRLSGKAAADPSDRTIDARRRIAEALDLLGGHDSAAGSCAWYVLGLETSVREWAMRQGWGGRPVAPPQAQGMLVATLSVLAGHFGLVPRTRAA
jgi:hypothetical protein